MTIVTNSKSFEVSYHSALLAVSDCLTLGRCNKTDCPLVEGCRGFTEQDKVTYCSMFLNGQLVFSKGELVEKDNVEEVFTLTINEKTGEVSVTPDFYHGDEILQSAVFRDICDVRLNDRGEEDEDGDNHMVRIPKIHYEMSKKGDIITAQISTKPIGRCLAHTKTTGEEKDFVYIGKYLCSELKGRLVSQPDKEVKTSISYNDVMKNIKGNYSKGYDMIGFHQLTLLQLLYLLRFKSLDSKKALGRGVSDAPDKIKTGGSDAKGCMYGDDSGKAHVKLCGIEDFFGNCFYFIGGIRTDDTHIIVDEKYKLPFKKGSGTVKRTVGDTVFGFCPVFD